MRSAPQRRPPLRPDPPSTTAIRRPRDRCRPPAPHHARAGLESQRAVARRLHPPGRDRKSTSRARTTGPSSLMTIAEALGWQLVLGIAPPAAAEADPASVTVEDLALVGVITRDPVDRLPGHRVCASHPPWAKPLQVAEAPEVLLHLVGLGVADLGLVRHPGIAAPADDCSFATRSSSVASAPRISCQHAAGGLHRGRARPARPRTSAPCRSAPAAARTASRSDRPPRSCPPSGGRRSPSRRPRRRTSRGSASTPRSAPSGCPARGRRSGP